MSAASLLRERNELLTDRFPLAERLGLVEWTGAIVEEKAHIVLVLRALVHEQRATDPDAAEVIGRLRAALDLLRRDPVDVGSLDTIIAGAIVALGGQA